MKRTVLGIGLFMLGLGLMLFQPAISPNIVVAQKTKDKDKEIIDQLQKQLKDARGDLTRAEVLIKNLNQELREREQKINQLQSQLKKKDPKDDGDQRTIAVLRKELEQSMQVIKDKDVMIASLRNNAPKATSDLSKQVEDLKKKVTSLEAVKNAGYVHVVIFKLKSDSPATEVKALTDDAVKVLGKISSVRAIWAGIPAEEATPEVAVKDYTVGMLVLFDNAEGLKKYLDDPLHKQFVEKHAKLWETPLVYDYLK